MSDISKSLTGIGDAADFAPALPDGHYVVEPTGMTHHAGELGTTVFVDVRVVVDELHTARVGSIYQAKFRLSGRTLSQVSRNLRDFKGGLKAMLSHNEGFQEWVGAGCPANEGMTPDQTWAAVVEQCVQNPKGFLAGSRCRVSAATRKSKEGRDYTVYTWSAA
jgi:hypothetical protein